MHPQKWSRTTVFGLSYGARPHLHLFVSALFLAFGCTVALMIVACGGHAGTAAKGHAAVEPPATAASVSGKPAGSTADGSVPPAAGEWIDVDVTNFVVRLMDGKWVLGEVSPVAVGEQIDSGEYASTQTGLFHVYEKNSDLTFDAQYNAYISHWVGFDPEKANGLHSFLMDEDGNVVNADTGRVSNGCVRTGAPEEIFGFAQIGMPVYVHW
jgi:hypothetical protein